MAYNLFCKTNEQPPLRYRYLFATAVSQPLPLRYLFATASPSPFHSRYCFAIASLPLRLTAVISEERNQTMCYIHIPFHI
jgi:hypothetical protein